MLQKWCEVTTCNGIIDLYEARNSRKRFFFWVIVMVSMAAISVYYTYSTVYFYITSPTVTNLDVIQVSALDMPDVLVCYNGGVNVTKMLEANFTQEFISTYVNSWDYSQVPVNDPKAELLHNELWNYLALNRLTLSNFVQYFWYKCEEITPSPKCTTSVPIITDMGLCHLFKDNMPQLYPSVYSGVQLKLMEPNDSFAQIYPDKIRNRFLSHGFSITIEKRLGSIWSHRFLSVPLNMKVEIILHPMRFKRLINKSCKNVTNTTTSTACYYKCARVEQLSKYNCTHHSLYVINSTTLICDPFTFDVRKIDVVKVDECSSKCLPLCDEWKYDTTLSYTQLADANLNQTIVYIGHDEMQYKMVEEVESFTLDTAIANIGGQAGLWLGAGVLTIVQALYYFVLLVCEKISLINVANLHQKCYKCNENYKSDA